MRGRSLLAFLAGVLVTAVVALGLSVAIGDDAPSARQTATATATPAAVAGGSTRPLGVAEIVERVSSGVVFVGSGQGGGSGFLIDPDGDIVTNQHVVDDAQTAQVRFGGSGEAVPARVRGADASTDLALLKVDPEDIPGDARPLELAPSRDLRPGDARIAVGDRIVRFDGQAVEDPSALSSAVLDRRPGEVVEVVVRDGSDERTVRVRLGDRPEEAVQP